MRASLFLAATLTLAACHKPAPERQGLDALDDQLTGNAGNLADPVMSAALHDQIMVDPALAQAGNRDRNSPPVVALAPSPTPTATASLGLSRSPVAAAAPAAPARQGTIARCAGSLDHAAGWAARLPPGVALYPDAHIEEAAGSDANGCALRVVSFTSRAPVADIAAWYRDHATGFVIAQRAAGGRVTITGDAPTRAFILYLEPRRGGGTSADLIADGGR